MKRLLTVFFVAIMILSLMACSDSGGGIVGFCEEINGRLCDVDMEEKTILVDNTELLHIRIEKTDSDYKIYIIYPDDNYYGKIVEGSSSSATWSDGYSLDTHLSGADIISHIEEKINVADFYNEDGEENSGTGYVIVSILCFIVGILLLTEPHMMWFTKAGWKYKDAKPSEAAISYQYVAGGILMLLGFIILLMIM